LEDKPQEYVIQKGQGFQLETPIGDMMCNVRKKTVASLTTGLFIELVKMPTWWSNLDQRHFHEGKIIYEGGYLYKNGQLEKTEAIKFYVDYKDQIRVLVQGKYTVEDILISYALHKGFLTMYDFTSLPELRMIKTVFSKLMIELEKIDEIALADHHLVATKIDAKRLKDIMDKHQFVHDKKGYHYHTCSSCLKIFGHDHGEEGYGISQCSQCDKATISDIKLATNHGFIVDTRYTLSEVRVLSIMAKHQDKTGRSLVSDFTKCVEECTRREKMNGYQRLRVNWPMVDTVSSVYYPVPVYDGNVVIYRSIYGYVVFIPRQNDFRVDVDYTAEEELEIREYIRSHPFIRVQWLNFKTDRILPATDDILESYRQNLSELQNADAYAKLLYLVQHPTSKIGYYKALNLLRASHYLNSMHRSNSRGYIFSGEPGLGKSYDLTRIVGEKDEKLSDQYVVLPNVYDVSYDPKAKLFFDGYVGQPIIRFDDVGHFSGDEWTRLIRVVNDVPYKLPMAKAENKDLLPVLAEEVYVTTNKLDKLLELPKATRDAICRRFEVFEYTGNVVLHKLYNLKKGTYQVYQVLTRDQLVAYFRQEVCSRRQLPLSQMKGKQYIWRCVTAVVEAVQSMIGFKIQPIVDFLAEGFCKYKPYIFSSLACMAIGVPAIIGIDRLLHKGSKQQVYHYQALCKHKFDVDVTEDMVESCTTLHELVRQVKPLETLVEVSMTKQSTVRRRQQRKKQYGPGYNRMNGRRSWQQYN
jgi:hypothetical protein